MNALLIRNLSNLHHIDAVPCRFLHQALKAKLRYYLKNIH